MKNKKQIAAVLLIPLTVGLIVLLIFAILKSPEKADSSTDSIRFEYYEDKTGALGLDEIRTVFSGGGAVSNDTGQFSFGNSASTYWVQIPLNELPSTRQEEYLLIYNPTVAKAVLHVPVEGEAGAYYKTLSSGWSFNENRQDEGFAYPAFFWDENTDFEQDAYLELYSPYTQNYTLDFLSYLEFKQLKQNSFMLNGILFGILFAVAAQNLFVYIVLKEKANLYYFFYVLGMGVYQGCLLGMYNVLAPGYSRLLMSNTITLSLVVICAAILFFRSFFRTKKLFRSMKNYQRVCWRALPLEEFCSFQTIRC